MNKQYYIYLRKSRKDQELEHELGDTLTRHRKQLLELARQKHLTISAIYEEVVSGETIAQRPEMQRMLGDIEQGGCEGVLVMEVERLARGDTVDQGIISRTFSITGTKIITPTKIYDPNNEFDQEYFEFGLFMSRREYKTINRRIQAGRLSSVKEGKFVGNIPPYGYNRQKIEKGKGYMLVPNKNEAPVVQKIFELYTQRLKGYAYIATYLNKHEIPPRKAQAWTGPSIRDILHNPVYFGKMRWGYRSQNKKIVDGTITISRPKSSEYPLYDGLHQPLISEDVFNAAREISAKHRAPAVPLNMTISNPFAGIVVCKKCGHNIVRRKTTSKNGQKCDRLLCDKTYCNCVSVSFDAFEKIVLDTLAEWLRKYSIQFLPENSHAPINFEYYNTNIIGLEKDLEVLNKQLEKCYTLLEQDVYSIDVFAERSAALKKQISTKADALQNFYNELSKMKKNEEHAKSIIPKLTYLLENYDHIETAEEKNRLLKQIISKIMYEKTEKGKRGKRGEHDETPFTVDIFPYLP